MEDKHPSYWEEYSNLQFTKHKLIREYLNGWFPKLGSWSGKILYVDTHAGKGKHKGGQEGSPLIALRTFLNHSWRDKILNRCKMQFIFIEWSEVNADQLRNEIKSLGELPPNISYEIYHQNAFELLEGLANEFEKTGTKLAPCFMFVDPYGFDIPCDLLKRIKAHSNSELLITLIWRELDMAMRQKTRPTGLTDTINRVFGGKEWEDLCLRSDSDDRGESAVRLVKDKIGAKWATYIRMLGENQKTRYFLLHLTDHQAGRDLIKEVVWKCCPDNGYYVRKKDNPNQQYLIKPEPDLTGLRNWLLAKLSRKPYTWNELTEILREEIWLNKHLWQVVKEGKNANRINATNFRGRFSQKANPTLSLVANGA
jgi:three-Cys-motif partner protein